MTEDQKQERGRGEPPAEMTTLYLGFLKKGPTWTAEASEQIRQDQRGHLANFADLAADGKLLLAGPTPNADDLRGIVVFQAASLEAARGYLADDPHLQSGRLLLELHEWMVDVTALKRPLLPPTHQDSSLT